MRFRPLAEMWAIKNPNVFPITPDPRVALRCRFHAAMCFRVRIDRNDTTATCSGPNVRSRRQIPGCANLPPRSQRLHPGSHIRRRPSLRKHRDDRRSSLRLIDLATGNVLQKHDLAHEFFGEGLTDWGSTLIQLTWTSHKAFVYDRFSFSLLRTMSFEGEGWGLTHDETQLILSDGTPTLRFLDPKSLRVTRRLRVTDQSGHAVENLNELEYVRGEIYANVWQRNEIIRISPRSGKVLGESI